VVSDGIDSLQIQLQFQFPQRTESRAVGTRCSV
jgi:hypothetical protein